MSSTVMGNGGATGIASIAVEHQQMIGKMVVVRLTNGTTIVIDALHLGDEECQVGVYRDWDSGGEKAGLPGAVVRFDGTGPMKVNSYPEDQ